MIGAPFADVRVSPNFGPRRAGGSIDLLLLHYTAMQSAEAALQRLCDPIHEVSVHYLITLDGRVLQLVCESQRAWHAGRSFWAGETDINSRSIGIELDNRGDHPFSNKQMRALIALCGDIIGRHNIPAHRVLGHSDVAIGRKADPGARFDWRRLALSGVGVWPDLKTWHLNAIVEMDPVMGEDALRARAQFVKQAADYGYDPSFGLEQILSSLRQHFAPHRRGPLSRFDCTLVAALNTLCN